MSTPTKTLYRLEVRPLGISPFRRITVWNPKTQDYDAFTLRRGRWFTAHRREQDGRPVFGGNIPGATRLTTKQWVTAQAKAFKRKGFATRIVPVSIELYPKLTGDLDAKPELLKRLNTLADQLDTTIHVLSGGRTLAEQEFLYELYLAGKGNLAAKPNKNAPHIRGIAADAYAKGVALARVKGAKTRAAKLGLHFPVAGEDWHVELVDA